MLDVFNELKSVLLTDAQFRRDRELADESADRASLLGLILGFVNGQDLDIYRSALADGEDAVNGLHRDICVEVSVQRRLTRQQAF